MIIAIFRPFSVKNSDLFIRYVAPVTLRILGIKVIAVNQQQLFKSHPCIYLTNHQSVLDVFTVGHLLPNGAISVGKKSIRWIPFFGWVYYLSGHLLIDRGDNAKAVATMKKALERLAKRDISVMIAPEGTRSATLRSFKKGAFYLAVDSGLPLQPIATSSYGQFVDMNRWDSGTVIVKVLEPISTKGKTREHVDELLALAHERIRLGCEEINSELASGKLRPAG